MLFVYPKLGGDLVSRWLQTSAIRPKYVDKRLIFITHGVVTPNKKRRSESMKREFLKELGLSEEQVNSVMAEHGKTMNALNVKLSAAEESVKALNEQIAARDKDIKDLKKSATDNEDLSQRYSDLEAKYKQEKSDFDKKIADTKLDHAIDMSLVGKVHDSSIVRSLLDRSKLAFDEQGNLTGLDDQLAPLQESKGFLFIQEGAPSTPNPTPPYLSRQPLPTFHV